MQDARCKMRCKMQPRSRLHAQNGTANLFHYPYISLIVSNPNSNGTLMPNLKCQVVFQNSDEGTLGTSPMT